MKVLLTYQVCKQNVSSNQATWIWSGKGNVPPSVETGEKWRCLAFGTCPGFRQENEGRSSPALRCNEDRLSAQNQVAGALMSQKSEIQNTEIQNFLDINNAHKSLGFGSILCFKFLYRGYSTGKVYAKILRMKNLCLNPVWSQAL